MNASDVLMVDVLSGGIGGIAAVCASQPLDTVKVKMQLFPNMYRSMFKCLSSTVRLQGLRGLYAGTSPAIMAMCADNAIMFAAYGQSQRAVASFAGVGDTTRLSYLQNAAAGSIASLFTSTMICPMELVKIRMQAETTCKDVVDKRSTSEVVRDIFRKRGLSGFFRGLKATVARECVGNAVFFGVYEWAREWLKPAGGRKENCAVAATVTAGAVAGASSWLVVYPVDVIKSRTQKSADLSTGGLRLIRDEARSAAGLVSKLYSGLLPTLIKAVPMAGALLYAVEFSKPILRRNLAELKEWMASWPKVDALSYNDFFSGWIAGIVSTFVGHPLNTVGTIQQVTDTNLKSATREVYTKDKFKGYFRGMMFPILSAGAMNAVCFGVYGNTKRLIHALRNDETEGDREDVRFCCDAKKLAPYWHSDVFLSGCVAGAFYMAITIPVEVVKTKLQLTKFPSTPAAPEQKEIVSPIKMMTQLYQSNGLRSLYRGGTMFVIRDVPSMGVYMLTYEHMCCELRKFYRFLNYDSALDDPMHKTEEKLVQITSGGLAGVLSWVLVLPFDVIKSKIIADDPVRPKYSSTWDCILKTYRQGGASHFFRGFWVLCLRAFIVNGITFVTYEALLKVLNRGDREDPPSAPDPARV